MYIYFNFTFVDILFSRRTYSDVTINSCFCLTNSNISKRVFNELYYKFANEKHDFCKLDLCVKESIHESYL